MADPVTLSIAIAKGVVTAAEIGWAAGKFINNTIKAPDQIIRTRNEAGAIELALNRLQELVLDDATARAPTAHAIQLHDLATVVIATVQTLSKLRDTINLVKDPKDFTFLDNIEWAWHKDSVERLNGQLRDDAVYLGLILNILQAENQKKLMSMPDDLRTGVRQLLNRDHDLAQRMSRLEACVMRTLQWYPSSIRHLSHQLREEDDSEINTVPASPHEETIAEDSEESNGQLYKMKDLDSMLAGYAVYRRAEQRGSLPSIAGSYKQSWSIFNGLRVSAISKLSVICLPIIESELLGSIPTSTHEPGLAEVVTNDLLANSAHPTQTGGIKHSPEVPEPPSVNRRQSRRIMTDSRITTLPLYHINCRDPSVQLRNHTYLFDFGKMVFAYTRNSSEEGLELPRLVQKCGFSTPSTTGRLETAYQARRDMTWAELRLASAGGYVSIKWVRCGSQPRSAMPRCYTLKMPKAPQSCTQGMSLWSFLRGPCTREDFHNLS